jgi:hypothetical protein
MKNSNAENAKRLWELESVIARGLPTALKMSDALGKIRDYRLYPESYATFEEYYQKRWDKRGRTSAQSPKIPRRSLSTDAFVAYHEAGHAVAAWCLKLKVPSVTIVPDDDSAGHVESEREDQSICDAIDRGDRWDTSRFMAEKLVMGLQAGRVAQQRYSARSVRRRHYANDLSKCVALLLKYDPDRVKPNARLHRLLLDQWTESLIEQHWHLVEAVAEALLERRELSGTELLKVINDVNQQRDGNASTHPA